MLSQCISVYTAEHKQLFCLSARFAVCLEVPPDPPTPPPPLVCDKTRFVPQGALDIFNAEWCVNPRNQRVHFTLRTSILDGWAALGISHNRKMVSLEWEFSPNSLYILELSSSIPRPSACIYCQLSYIIQLSLISLSNFVMHFFHTAFSIPLSSYR